MNDRPGPERPFGLSLSKPLAGIVAMLAGCASYGPGGLNSGADEVTIQRSMGVPSERHALPAGGTRLVYARGPMGQHTWMLDLGGDGRLRAWHQALGESQFAALQPGIGIEELRRTIGPPAHRRPTGRDGAQVWSWRYPTFECRWFQADIDAGGRFAGGSYAIDPMCDDRGDKDDRL